MSKGLKISFGRLCRLEEERKKLEQPEHEWETDTHYGYTVDNTHCIINKKCVYEVDL